MDIEQRLSKPDFRVTRETPLGQALRRYWTPACLSAELPHVGCAPIRLRLLGDSFVAFRDNQGRVGVLDEPCPHRKASLVYGRNEGDGLRCLWHQWKFDVRGKLLDTPNVSDPCFKERVRARAYRVRESGGLVWAYFGPPDLEPPFREYGWSVRPERNCAIVPVDLDCSFVKALEALVDSSHISLLHVDSVNRVSGFKATMSGEIQSEVDSNPTFDIEDTDFGFHYGALRKTGEDKVQVRVTAYVAPYLCFVAPANTAFLSVPQDDTHCRYYNIMWFPNLPFEGAFRSRWMEFMGLQPEILEANGLTAIPTGPGPLGARNHIVQDREAMELGKSYSGLSGLNVEDAAMVCSIPGVSDYQGEHLTPADVGVVTLRRTLWQIAKQVAKGETSLGVRLETDSTLINSADGIIPRAGDWRQLVPHARAGDHINSVADLD